MVSKRQAVGVSAKRHIISCSQTTVPLRRLDAVVEFWTLKTMEVWLAIVDGLE